MQIYSNLLKDFKVFLYSNNIVFLDYETLLIMFKKETEYALRSLIYIQSKNIVNIRPGIIEIASEIDSPQSFTAKILQRLVKNGFIKSQKGKNGGFFFEKDKPELTLKEVIYSIEGDKSTSTCGLGLGSCDDTCQCPIHESFSLIREATEKLITEETIQNLVKKKSLTDDIVLNRL